MRRLIAVEAAAPPASAMGHVKQQIRGHLIVDADGPARIVEILRQMRAGEGRFRALGRIDLLPGIAESGRDLQPVHPGGRPQIIGPLGEEGLGVGCLLIVVDGGRQHEQRRQFEIILLKVGLEHLV